MASRASTKFRKIVQKLWLRKASKLLGAIKKKERIDGRRLAKRYRETQLRKLLDLTEKIMLPVATQEVGKRTERRSVFFRKGMRRDKKWSHLKERMSRDRKKTHLVYTLWDSSRRCLKVGRSDKGIGRLYGQRDSYYFWLAHRVKFYFPRKRKKGSLPALECVLTHKFRPKKFDVMPAKRKFRQKCPVCHMQKFVRREVRRLFPAN